MDHPASSAAPRLAPPLDPAQPLPDAASLYEVMALPEVMPLSEVMALPDGQHAPDDVPPIGHATIDTPDTLTRGFRHDGWTPATRAGFLDALARSGVITDACRAAGISAAAAYKLRHRDAVFAAGWDTALGLARARLADDLFARSVHGSIEQVWRDGVIVAERHRHDNRLSMAVLNRLDARCDRAERLALPTRRVAAQWDAYLGAIAEDRPADAEAILAEPPPAPRPPSMLGVGSDTALLAQLRQLKSGRALDEGKDFDPDHPAPEPEAEDEERVWTVGMTWRTSWPPPPGFCGDEEGDYGDFDYHRQCTLDERDLLDRAWPDAFIPEVDEELEADQADRDGFFEELAAKVAAREAAAAEDDAEEDAGEREQDEVDHGEAEADQPPSPAY